MIDYNDNINIQCGGTFVGGSSVMATVVGTVRQ